MIAVTKSLALQEYTVIRSGQTHQVQIVPQITSSLRLELIFWNNYTGIVFPYQIIIIY